MSKYDQFITTISKYDNHWLNTYMDELKRLFLQLNIISDMPQLAMSVRKDHEIPVNIGQRWIAKPLVDHYVGIELPLDIDEKDFDCELIGYYRRNRMNEAKWVKYKLTPGSKLPDQLFNEWVSATASEIQRCKKSGFRRYHSELYYDLVMNEEFRDEIFISL